MVRVRDRQRHGIAEGGCRLRKRDAVLLSVGFCLGRIPNEPQHSASERIREIAEQPLDDAGEAAEERGGGDGIRRLALLNPGLGSAWDSS